MVSANQLIRDQKIIKKRSVLHKSLKLGFLGPSRSKS
jgi:hypothetical protein